MPDGLKKVICAASLLLGAVTAHAAFVQSWLNNNPDNPRGPFDAMAFRFVSQTPAQTGFLDVNIRPVNGWVSLGFDPLLTYAVGNENQEIRFDLTFDGAGTDDVQWEVWYFRDQQSLGGALYVGKVDRTLGFRFDNLSPQGNPPPAPVPEPASWALAGLALLGCAVASRRRSTPPATCA